MSETTTEAETESPVVFKLRVNFPNQHDNYEVQIPGLGTFKNGNEYEVTEDEAYRFQVYHTRMVPVVDDETSAILGSQAQLGQSLDDAANTMYGVEVESVGEGYTKPTTPIFTPDPVVHDDQQASTTETETDEDNQTTEGVNE